MAITIEQLRLDGRGLTEADVRAALERTPGIPPLPPETGKEVSHVRSGHQAVRPHAVTGGAHPRPRAGGRSRKPRPAPPDLRSLLGLPPPVPPGAPAPSAAPDLLDPYLGMNRGETRYAREVLDARKAAGLVLWWRFEGLKLRLAPLCFLTVDFVVVAADGRVSLVDVKGRKMKVREDGSKVPGCWVEPDAMLKLRVAASLFPFPLSVAWPRKGGGWDEERVGP